MRTFRLVITIIMVFFGLVAFSANNESKVKILLIGDSTTAGGKPVLEKSIEQLIAAEDRLPIVEVINAGLGGETAYGLLNSGRYNNQIKDIGEVDYIFLRYGINDWIHRKPFAENFPADMKKVIAQLRQDFPNAEIILMTIIPFFEDEQASKMVNAHIAQVASDEQLELFDIYTPYQKKVEEFGRNSLTVRFFPLRDIPENYQKIVAPFTQYYSWKDAEWVRVQSNEFDPLFGHLPNWYKDSHPNTTGYRIIADETARFILPKLRKQ